MVDETRPADQVARKFLDQLRLAGEMSPQQRQALLSSKTSAEFNSVGWIEDCLGVFTRLVQLPALVEDAPFWKRMLDVLEAALPRDSEQTLILRNDSDAPLGELYRKQANSAVRGRIARFWAEIGTTASLHQFANAMVEMPPTLADDVTLAFTPLFQRTKQQAVKLFPQLWAGLASPTVAVCVLDLANYLHAQRIVNEHPGRDLAEQLGSLLEHVSQRLLKLVEQSGATQETAPDAREVIRESTPLVVSLCHTLARFGNQSLSYRLRTAMSLPHRHLQSEAAFAMASLGEKEGTEKLLELVQEVGARTRALAYLQELGQLDQVPDAYRSPEAQRFGELAVWLAEPTRYGIPPQQITQRSVRQLVWPGFKQEVTCRLAEFEYRFAQGTIRSVALLEPYLELPAADVHAWGDEELFCLFAGMAADHEEIFHSTVSETKGSRPELLDDATWRNVLHGAPSHPIAALSQVQLVRLGAVFDKRFWVVSVLKAGVPYEAVIIDDQVTWFERQSAKQSAAPLPDRELAAFAIGRILLTHFNREDRL